MSVSKFIYEIDEICRRDLSKLILVSERDYVSQFNTLIRYPNGYKSKSNPSIYVQTLKGDIEQKIGCDSIMIFKIENKYKVGLFESKLPRYKTVNPLFSYSAWDNGRFNKQL